MSKIERTEAIENLEEIVEASDVVMVARGDLGVEIGDAELPGLQKKIIKASLAQNKVVITATQMLQSMVESPIPTRAEVLDVANSVIDGTDAVMLSAETAAGAWPVKAVEAMARICLGAERQFQTETDFNASPRNLERADQAIAMATMFLSQHVGVRAIVAMTESGGTARYLSRFRAKAPVFAVTRHDGARRQMALMRDVFPINFDSRGLTPREAARGSIRLLVEAELLQAGDRVVFTSGEHMETHGATNTLRLLEVERTAAPSAWATSEARRGRIPARALTPCRRTSLVLRRHWNRFHSGLHAGATGGGAILVFSRTRHRKYEASNSWLKPPRPWLPRARASSRSTNPPLPSPSVSLASVSRTPRRTVVPTANCC